MTGLDLKKGIKKCYFLWGEDSFTRRAAEEKIKKAVVDESAEMMNVSIFNDVKTTAGQVIEAAETTPFLSDKRFILVKDCGFFSEGEKAESDILADYVQNLPDTACIVFSEEKADKRLKLFKAVEKNGMAAEFGKLKDNDLASLAEKKLTKSGLKIPKNLCIYMVRNCVDAEMLRGECEKLIAYMDGRSEVSAEDIDAVCVKNSETKVFDLADAMIAGKTEKALEIYRNLLALNESPFMVLSLITRQFRIILKCKSLSESGYSGNDIAKKIGTAPFVANAGVRQSRNFSYDTLKRALNKCIETDYSIKSGALDAVSGIEILIADGVAF